MCEYKDGCTEVTDPDAKALSENPREADAVLVVLCQARHHLIAAVYDLPERGKVLCQPHFQFRAGDLFHGPGVTDPYEIWHMHPTLEPLESSDPDESEFGRCHCGTWEYRVRSIVDLIAAHEEGRILPAPVGGLVKVQLPNGAITKLSRTYAEMHQLPIIGSVNSKRSGRLHIVANYVETNNTPMK